MNKKTKAYGDVSRFLISGIKPALFYIVGLAAAVSISGCTKKEPPKKVQEQQALVEVSTVGKKLIQLIELSKDSSYPPSILPPTTHNGFWVSGNTATLGTYNNDIKGLTFTRWEEGMEPTGGAVAAFQGWIFLQPSGKAKVFYQKFFYKLGRQSVAEAFAVKHPNNYEKDGRLYNAKWEIFGDSIKIAIEGENPDPKHFSTEGKSCSVVYKLSSWKNEADIDKEIEAAVARTAKIAKEEEDARKKAVEAESNKNDPKIFRDNIIMLIGNVNEWLSYHDNSMSLAFDGLVRDIQKSTVNFKSDGKDYVYYANVFRSIHDLIDLKINRNMRGINDRKIDSNNRNDLQNYIRYSSFDSNGHPAMAEDYRQIFPIEQGRVFQVKLKNGEILKLRYKWTELERTLRTGKTMFLLVEWTDDNPSSPEVKEPAPPADSKPTANELPETRAAEDMAALARAEVKAAEARAAEARAAEAKAAEARAAEAKAAEARAAEARAAEARAAAAAVAVAEARDAEARAVQARVAKMSDLFEIGAVGAPPTVRSQARASYPDEMRRKGIPGEVVVGIVVGTNGNVIESWVIRSTRLEFEKSALDAVRNWQFSPGRMRGRSVNVRMEIPIAFTINNE
jgi:TonB family protein